ncbi:MAG TPA: aminodeoxychorismate/anthranilate synthase component II [Fibrobacteria bacterium]|nr:aminodeoxychorismate/anthranilate synthase component II [Fibrobacteria bacterium]HOX50480.1 aminodeoxychorismate/anthranilate synthase component II [Fibrobacteria bacterium]
MTARLFMLDNYDSFTFNLVQMFRVYPLDVVVVRSDKIDVEGVEAMRPDYVVVSPGPKDPQAAGISVPLIRRLHASVPILGVCLGMQSMNEAFGGTTIRAPLPMHGKTDEIRHEGRGIFQGIPNPCRIARYHSLAVTDIDPCLEVTATTSDGVVMGLSHREHPLHGVQFHPESFLTEHGFGMIENFLKLGPLRSVLP